MATNAAMVLAKPAGMKPRDIAEAFTAAGFPLNKSEVVMGEGPLRHTGEYEVMAHFAAEVETPVKVIVVADEG